ncbi:MAG: hypothetical protein ABIL69_01330 [candidate division WOR-3 bacterium]
MSRKNSMGRFDIILTFLFIFSFATGQEKMEKSDEIVEDTIKNLFKDKYDNPVVNLINLPYCFQNLKYLRVYDYSQLVEDPLIPTKWVVTPSMKKFRIPLSGEDIKMILSEIAFLPSSSEEALTATKVIAEWLYEYGSLIDDINSNSFQKIIKSSQLNFAQVKNPEVIKIDSGYIINCYIYQPKVNILGFDIIPFEVLVKLCCEFSKNAYKLEQIEIDATYLKKTVE